MKLIIFDLDQTLVDPIAVHDKVTRRLFKEFFDVDANLTEIDFAGRSLIDNLHALARLKSIAEGDFKQKSEHLLERYDSLFVESLPRDATEHILPGARELLSALSRTEHIVSLYTGDSPEVARSVLKATGLERYFRFCLYGTEVETRADMVKSAIVRAEKSASQQFVGRNVIGIGDSTRDVECGKQFNALTIAVATGSHSEKQLAAVEPDYLLSSLKDYGAVLSVIDSSKDSMPETRLSAKHISGTE